MIDVFELVVALMIAQPGGAYGRGIQQRLVELGMADEMDEATTLNKIYPILKRLSDAGYCTKCHVPCEGRGPGRYMYQYTANGQRNISTLMRTLGSLSIEDDDAGGSRMRI